MVTRYQVLKIYHDKCAISNVSAEECQVAHIIPRHLEPSLVAECNNCILLSNNLHNRFDKYDWTFDIYSVNYNNICGNYVEIDIVTTNTIKKRKNSSHIGGFLDKRIKVWKDSLPYIYVHYHIFIIRNFTVDSRSNLELTQQFMSEIDYNKLQKHDYLYFNTYKKPKKRYHYNCLLDSSYNAEQLPIYLVLWDGYSFREATWEIDPPQKAIVKYDQFKLEQENPAFSD